MPRSITPWLITFLLAAAVSMLPVAAAAQGQDSAAGYLIIAPDEFESALADFVALKTAQGFQTDLALLSETSETKELIKAYLLNYSPRPHYVLLVGDIDLIPAWDTTENTGDYTDLYYTTFDGPTDMVPNVILGRLPVQNVAQLTALVAKYIAYDQMSYGETWHRQLSFISDANEDYYEKVENIHEIVVEHYTAPLGYSGTFPEANDLPAPTGGDRLYPLTYGATKQDLLTVIDKGRVMLVYNGMGSPTKWQWKTDDDFTVADVQSLSGPPVPLVLALADKTASFNEEVSMADAWLLNEESGALVYIGASIETYADFEMQIEQLFFDKLFLKEENEDEPKAVGDAFIAALKWVQKNNQDFAVEMQAYQLLGDPSLQIPWPEPPPPDPLPTEIPTPVLTPTPDPPRIYLPFISN